MKSTEIDIHVWAKPATKGMAALFTVSVGNRTLCKDLPIDQATAYVEAYFLEMVGAEG